MVLLIPTEALKFTIFTLTCAFSSNCVFVSHNLLFCLEIFLSDAKRRKFPSKILLDEKFGNVEDGQQLQSPLFSSLATVYIVLLTCWPRTEYQRRP